MLEKQFHYKLTISDIRGSAHRDKLIEAIKSIKVLPQPEMTDIRWGVIFYGLDSSRVVALYFNKIGSGGAVADDSVSFKGNVFKWLDGNFSTSFR